MQAPTSVAKPVASSPILVLERDLQADGDRRWKPGNSKLISQRLYVAESLAGNLVKMGRLRNWFMVLVYM